MTKELAVAGHDYFEAAFYSFADNKLVRASWELKTEARVSGITRGVDYQYTSVSISGAAPATRSAAIIFVGKKTDRTLLGVGRLTAIDNGAGTTPGTTITNDTRSITFTVAALECGIDSNPANSSFFTNYNVAPGGSVSPVNTLIDSFVMNNINNGGLNRQFPKYKLIQGGITGAEYTFRVASANFNDYRPGIILAGAPACEKKQPRYQLPGGGFQYYSLRLDEKTKATVVNNNTLGNAFSNPIQFAFDTNGEDGLPDTGDETTNGSVFALAFQVPVFPLSSTAAFNGVEPGTWYIRASYDSYWLDLDGNGSGGPGGSGGAVLLGMGDPALYSGYKLVLVTAPTKYQYGPYALNSTKWPTDYDFLITGLTVQLRTDPGDTLIRTVAYNELTFSIGGWGLDPTWTLPAPGGGPAQPDKIRDELYGIQFIKVEYIDPYSGDDHAVSFPIIVSGGIPTRDFSIDRDKTAWIKHPSDLTNNNWQGNFMFTSGTTGTYVIVFDHSIDLYPIVMQQNYGPYLLIILASNAGVKVGRAPNLLQGAFVDWDRKNSYYFGTWPFGSIEARVLSGTNGSTWQTSPIYEMVTATYPYAINAGGSQSAITWAAPYTTPPTATVPVATPPRDDGAANNPAPPAGDGAARNRFFAASGQTGRLYNVTAAGDIHVLNRVDWFR